MGLFDCFKRKKQKREDKQAVNGIRLGDKIPGCEHFYWREFLFCPQWGIYAFPPPHIKKAIISTAQKMERVRSILGGESIEVTSGWRPKLYNDEIGGADKSAHITGLACDFQHFSKTAQECREILIPHLQKLDLRMEKLESANWVHIDRRKPGHARYFIP